MRCSIVVVGALNGDVFEAFVEPVLVPELRPGDVVVLDNLSSHKHPRVHDFIASAGARLVFPPPHSSDLNPIEMIFARIKQSIRSPVYRTRNASGRAIQSALNQIPPSEAYNCYRHWGNSLPMD